MLQKYGDKPRPVAFYAERYLNAFPMLIQYFMPDYSTPEDQFYRCYSTRAFARFFLWFGFVTADGNHSVTDIETHKYANRPGIFGFQSKAKIELQIAQITQIWLANETSVSSV